MLKPLKYQSKNGNEWVRYKSFIIMIKRLVCRVYASIKTLKSVKAS